MSEDLRLNSGNINLLLPLLGNLHDDAAFGRRLSSIYFRYKFLVVPEALKTIGNLYFVSMQCIYQGNTSVHRLLNIFVLLSENGVNALSHQY